MINGTAVIGLQNGDEGKAKILVYIIAKAIARYGLTLVQRWQGGANAGHTAVVDGIEYKFHQVPTGICLPNTYNLMGNGMYISPKKLMEEIRALQQRGLTLTPGNFGIAACAHVTFDYHTDEDASNFQKKKHTSTGNGIKQTGRDKFDRRGIRFIEFLNPDTLAEALREKTFPDGTFPQQYGSIREFVESYEEVREFLQQFVIQEHEAIARYGQNYWVGEGAQAALLDVDMGQYPGVTSSKPASPPNSPNNSTGVIKLYTSSVGTGDRPFVARMEENLESALRDAWDERGTTTGRDRELGWLDIVALKYTMAATRVNKIVGTCADRLEDVAKQGETLKLVVAYEIDGKRYDKWDISFHDRTTLRNAKPIVEELPAFEKFHIDGKLTPNAQRYIDRVQELLGKEFCMIGIGPDQNDIIEYSDPLAS